MRNIGYALRTFFRKGNGNIIKVLSLGVGLAIGIVLIAKVLFESSYERFFPDNERIYSIQTYCHYSQDPDNRTYETVSGAIAQGFQDYVPGVECATMLTDFAKNVFYTAEKEKISATTMLADSNFFKVFQRPILVGDPVKALSLPWHAMISKTMADNLGGIDGVIGKTIFNETYPTAPITIDGVFEDFPENSILRYDVLVSIQIIHRSSRERWMGNDRYRSYLRLAKGVDPKGEDVISGIRKMQLENQDIEKLEEEGGMLTYILLPFNSLYSGSPHVRNTIVLLSFLAFILILTSVMNYILVVISSLVRRTKEIGIRKCYGAEGINIRSLMLSEAFIHLLFSLVIAAILILSFRGTIEELLGASLKSVFSPIAIIVILVVCALVFLVSGLIPSYLFEKIPVSTVFRNYRESKRKWKRVLLSFQFAATAILTSLLIVIVQQYNMMADGNPGYDYENVILVPIGETTPKREVAMVMEELNRIPNVLDVQNSYDLPIRGSSGNNIRLLGEDRDLFNIADQYWVSAGYWKMMNIKILEGETPTRRNQVAVSKKFIDAMKPFRDWSDGIVGKEIMVTEHTSDTIYNPSFMISCVYEDYRIGSISDLDERPSVMFFGDENTTYNYGIGYILIKLAKEDSQTLASIQSTVRNLINYKDVVITSYREEMRYLYEKQRKFRDAVLIGSIVTLFIALLGLIGYTNDETNRRGKEIAVRKVNGAVTSEVMTLFIKDICIIAVPSVLLGSICSYLLAYKWLQQFAEKISLSPLIFIIGAVAVLAVIISVVAIDCYKSANENPVKSIISE